MKNSVVGHDKASIVSLIRFTPKVSDQFRRPWSLLEWSKSSRCFAQLTTKMIRKTALNFKPQNPIWTKRNSAKPCCFSLRTGSPHVNVGVTISFRWCESNMLLCLWKFLTTCRSLFLLLLYVQDLAFYPLRSNSTHFSLLCFKVKELVVLFSNSFEVISSYRLHLFSLGHAPAYH